MNELKDISFKIIMSKRICKRCEKTISPSDGLIDFSVHLKRYEYWRSVDEGGSICICIRCWNELNNKIEKEMLNKEDMFNNKSRKHVLNRLK